MVILDTDILVGLLRNNNEAKKKLQQFINESIPLCTTTITSFELIRGALLSNHKKENLQKVMTLLSSLKIYAFTNLASFFCAEKMVQIQKQGKNTGFADIMIASIAITEKENLVTRNVKDFKTIDGVNYHGLKPVASLVSSRS